MACSAFFKLCFFSLETSNQPRQEKRSNYEGQRERGRERERERKKRTSVRANIFKILAVDGAD
jgi:hypothetical protein